MTGPSDRGAATSWRRALLPGERHGYWANPGWYDARSVRPEDDADDVPALRAALVRALPPLPPGAAVLDLGAGTGALSLLLLGPYPDLALTLLDASPAALDRAAAKIGASHPSARPILLGEAVDPEALRPLPGGPYDLVTSAIALHDIVPPDPPDDPGGPRRHTVRHVSLLRRALGALRPGGHLVYADAMRPGFRVNEHLFTLGDAGFAEVDCAYVRGRLLVCGGQRPII